MRRGSAGACASPGAASAAQDRARDDERARRESLTHARPSPRREDVEHALDHAILAEARRSAASRAVVPEPRAQRRRRPAGARCAARSAAASCGGTMRPVSPSCTISSMLPDGRGDHRQRRRPSPASAPGARPRWRRRAGRRRRSARIHGATSAWLPAKRTRSAMPSVLGERLERLALRAVAHDRRAARRGRRGPRRPRTGSDGPSSCAAWRRCRSWRRRRSRPRAARASAARRRAGSARGRCRWEWRRRARAATPVSSITCSAQALAGRHDARASRSR